MLKRYLKVLATVLVCFLYFANISIAYTQPENKQAPIDQQGAPNPKPPIVPAHGLAPADAQPPVVPAAKPEIKGPPQIKILCVEVVDQDFPSKVADLFSNTKSSVQSMSICPETDVGLDNKKNTVSQKGELIGAGDVIVTIPDEDYKKAVSYIDSVGKGPTLFINGVDIGNNAELISIEQSPTHARLRYYVTPGPNSQALWAALFREGGILQKQPLKIAIGWNGTPTTYPASGAFMSNTIRVSDGASTTISIIAIIGIIGIWLYVMFATDTFRDRSTQSFWQQAVIVNRAYNNAENPDDYLKMYNNNYDPQQKNIYKEHANLALNKKFVEPENELSTIFGLALQKNWSPVRPSFSLGRLQFGVWFLFAVSVGIFFWILYGELPKLDGSVLALVALSTGVAGMSIAVDQAADRKFTPTEGLLKDLTVGYDDQQKVYRFQAVIVNLLLLFIGVMHVFQQLSYPTFDGTWLAFLGVSGVALAAGKQLTEKK